MSKFVEAIKLYKRYGYDVKTGLNPYHFNGKAPLYYPFTFLFRINTVNELETGGGISPVEVYLLESLSSVYKSKNIFIIGNAFGWSTIVMALCFPNAKIVAIDAGIEGKDNMFGIELTNHIAKYENLNCIVEYGFSPQNTKEVIDKHFKDQKLDLVFIDGLHTNRQLLKDFYGVVDFCYEKTIFLFHDVINWKMKKAFLRIKNYLKQHDSMLLYRTTSGMGVSIPKDIHQSIKDVFLCFTENEKYIDMLNQGLTIKAKLKSFIGRFLPKKLKEKIKKMINWI
jgi:predicted O-methyltransferase YrrM